MQQQMNKVFRSAAIVTLAALAGCASGIPGLVDCPAERDILRELDAATYAVVLEIVTGPAATDVAFSTLGTAFAVNDRLLATNAHVTEFFNGLTGINVSRVLAVQSGTGTVVTLLRALTHPEYTGNPIGSPDVGLFTTTEVLPDKLTIANAEELATLARGDDLRLAGFPGDVDDLIPVIPGVTVPQATALEGNISAVRNYMQTEVTGENADYVQHQAPTTPGTSGSALIRCGKVVAVHNAGTVKIVLVVGPNGQVEEERQAAAANNFGVHAKYLTELIDLFEDSSLQGFELPPPFVPDGGGGGGGGVAAFAGNYTGGVQTPANAVHSVAIALNNGAITGQSTWAVNGDFVITGVYDAAGNVQFQDNAPERLGINRGIYIGTANAQTGRITGQYFEGNNTTAIANWSIQR